MFTEFAMSGREIAQGMRATQQTRPRASSLSGVRIAVSIFGPVSFLGPLLPGRGPKANPGPWRRCSCGGRSVRDDRSADPLLGASSPIGIS